MTPKSFVYLAVGTAAAVLLAIVSFASNNQWSTGRTAGEKLVPRLADTISKVAELEVRQGDNGVVLERTGGSWAVKTRAGYPADPVKARTLLVSLGEAELVESKTRNAERHAALELEDPAEKGAKSRLLRLLDANGKAIAEVVVGKKRVEGYGSGRQGATYVRKQGDVQTWLANVELDAPVAIRDWVKTSVLTVDTAKISRVAIEIPGEQALKIERSAAAPAKDAKEPKDGKDAKDGKEAKMPAQPGKLAFVGFPAEGKKLKDADAAETLARAISSIDMEDVRKLASPPTEGVSVVRIEVADGPTTTLRLRKEGDSHWLSVTATGEGEAKEAADEISGRTESWEFKIPSHKAESILKKRTDLLDAPAS
jgi:hypothetical protein